MGLQALRAILRQSLVRRDSSLFISNNKKDPLLHSSSLFRLFPVLLPRLQSVFLTCGCRMSTSPLKTSPTKRQLSTSPLKSPVVKKIKLDSADESSENKMPVVQDETAADKKTTEVLKEIGNKGSPTKAAPLTKEEGQEEDKLYFVKMTESAHVPTKGSKLAAGYDLKSAYKYTVPARGSCLVKTDIQIKLPHGCYGRVAPRSGLALKNKIDVGAGVIDEDYRGNVGVILFNHADVDFEVNEGDRVAQLICEKIYYPEAIEVKSLDDTKRGEGGFGSTGVSSETTA